jgi:hypothetical protein
MLPSIISSLELIASLPSAIYSLATFKRSFEFIFFPPFHFSSRSELSRLSVLAAAVDVPRSKRLCKQNLIIPLDGSKIRKKMKEEEKTN